MTAIGAAPSRALGSRARTRVPARPVDAARELEALPAAAPGVIPRAALVDRLIEAERASLALVVAPAGYGKTALLEQWAARDHRPFAWVRLRSADDDPLELARSVAAALAAALPGLRGELDMSGKRRRPLDAVTQSLESALGGGEPLVLVLDNGDALRSPAAFELVERLAGCLGPRSLVALSSRRQPPFPVARLRTERRLVELRTADLVLTRSEAAAAAASAGLVLDETGCALLAKKTEGWPAAVYLAALAVAGDPHPQRALASFGGDDRLVVDYVRDELLAELPADVIEFLARSSILTRLSGPVCDHVLERRDSALLLRSLSQMNLLVVPLDRTDTEFRYHALLAQALRAELRLREPELETVLHKRASEWYEQQGKRGSAIEHAIRAKDIDRAGTLLWEATPQLLGYGQTAVLAKRLSNFSREEITGCAPLALSAAVAQLAAGDRALAEHWCSAAERAPALDEPTRAGLLVLRAAVAGDIASMRSEAAAALETAAEDDPWRALACMFEGMAMRLTGDAEGAREHLEEGIRRSVAPAPAIQVLCLGQLALLAIDEKDWDDAEARAAIARAQVDRVGLDELPLAALVFAASAAVAAHGCRPEVAERDARQAERLLEGLAGFTPWYNAQCRIALAWAALRMSDTNRARHLLAQAARDLRDAPDATAAFASLRACQDQVEIVGAARAADAEQLTMAEMRVLQFLPTHLSFPEIADELYVSRNTVKTHVRAVYRKLMASSRSEAVQNARDAGLLESLAA